MTLERLAAGAAALGFTLYAVLDLAGRGHGAPRTVVLVGSVACVALMTLAATRRRES